LAEIKIRGTVGHAHAIRRVGEEATPVGKPESSIDLRQEGIRRTLIGPVYPGFERVSSQYVVPVVLGLPRIHDSLLRKIVCRTESKVGWGIESDICQSLIELTGRRKGVADGVTAEFNVQTREGSTKLVDHPAAKVVSPAGQNRLRQNWLVERIA